MAPYPLHEPYSAVRRPKIGDRQPDAAEQPAGQREADADHVGRVAVDPVDEPAAQSVEREATGHRERLAARQVGVQVAIAAGSRNSPS